MTGFGVVGHHGVIVGKAQRDPEALQVGLQGLDPGPGHDALGRLTEQDVVKVKERTLLFFFLLLLFLLFCHSLLPLEGQLETGV